MSALEEQMGENVMSLAVKHRGPRKQFTAERTRRARFTGQSSQDERAEGLTFSEGSSLPDLEGSTAYLLDRIEQLHQKFDSIGDLGDRGAQEVLEDDDTIRMEIGRLVKEIGRTKTELASLRHPMANDEDDKIMNATNELDAIVEATEHATSQILKNGEDITGLLEKIRSDSEIDPENRLFLDQIEAKLIGIIEACNFQDITGQRITKVVNTMRFIEERIKSMIDVWGVDSFSYLPIPEDDETDEDAKLLAGPQLEDQGLTQADIDAMFD